MGLSSCQPDYARHRDGSCGANGRRATPSALRRYGRGWGLRLILCCGLAAPAFSETLRIATFDTSLDRKGPGLLLRDIGKGVEDVAAVVRIITHAAPDVVTLQSVDYDVEGRTVEALKSALATAGHPLPFHIAQRPNTGVQTGYDLNRNGRFGEGADAQGYGRFAGQAGMVVLSAYPLFLVADHSQTLWAELPFARLPPAYFTEAETKVLRMSHTAHWEVDVDLPSGALRLMTWSAGAPVFDGPEDRNGLRNRDELLFWEGRIDSLPAGTPFVLLGKSNLDPVDGEGVRAAMGLMLSHPRLQDPEPSSAGAAALVDPAHEGPAAQDTVDFDEDGPGNLRVSYVLPWAEAKVVGAGVVWPAPDDASVLLGAAVDAAGPHRLVWVDIDF